MMNLSLCKKKLTRLLAMVIITAFCLNIITPAVLAENTGMDSMESAAMEGNSLQCGNMTSEKGFARKPIAEPPGDDYYINFNYMYPSGQDMSSLYVWSSYDGTEYDDVIITQTDNRLAAKTLQGTRNIDIPVAPDIWHNILIHVKEDNTFEIFIDGDQAKIGTSYSATQIGSGRMQAIGYIGDLSKAFHNGMAYFDNIRIFTQESIIAQEDFNGDISGWTYYDAPAVSPANPPVDIPLPVLSDVMVSSEKTGLAVGDASKLNILANLSDGSKAVMQTAQSVYLESSDTNIVQIEQSNGEFIARAVGEGTATVTARVTMLGVTKEANINLNVTLTPVLSNIRIQLDNSKLLEGDEINIAVAGEYTDGSTGPISTTQAAYYYSSDPAVASVNMNENGEAVLKGNAPGKATITAQIQIDEVPMQANIEIEVFMLKGMKLTSEKSNLTIDETASLGIVGVLTDDSEVNLDSNEIEIIRFQSSNPLAATVETADGTPVVKAVGSGISRITMSVVFRGETLNGEIQFIVSSGQTGGNSLQCGNMTSVKGFARKPIAEPPGDDYYINFNYMYPSGQDMSSFYVWSSYDGKEYDDLIIIQNENKLTAKTLQGTLNVDISIAPDIWHNVLIHIKEDNAFEIFINGEQAKIGTSYSATQIGSGRMQAIGYIGDVSKDFHNGMAYYDNIRAFTKEAVIAQEDFNGNISGWTYYDVPAVSPANPPADIPIPVLSDVKVSAGRTGLLVGNSTKIMVSGMLSDGSQAVTQLIQDVTLESSDTNIVQIQQNNDEFIARATGEGTARVTGRVTLDSVTTEAALDLIVSTEPALSDIRLEADSIKLLEGDDIKISVIGELTDGGTTQEINVPILFESSNSEVVRVSSGTNTEAIVRGIGPGKAIITASTEINGILRKAEIKIEVLGLDSIQLTIERLNLFIGDTAGVKVTGIMTDNSEMELSQVETITCHSSNTGVADIEIEGGKPVVHAVGLGEANIIVSVTFKGVTRTGTMKLNILEITNSKTRSTYYTSRKVEAARNNVQAYEWAKSIKDKAVADAEKYLNKGYDFLWNMVTPQSIPRSYGVSQASGCLNCGHAIDQYGNYPYFEDPLSEEWKLECPNCHMKFPSNDFKAYYESGLDKNRIFDPSIADKSLLVNTLYPEKGEKWGVDDGYGYIDDNGNRYTFIAYYNHWLWLASEKSKNCVSIYDAICKLRDAYIYTGDMRYARAGAIMLDRIADIYPYMDTSVYDKNVFLNSHGGSGYGKVVGRIWETMLATDLCSACDAFFPAIDDPEIIEFLTDKAQTYGLGVLKNSATGIRRNIEDGILRQIYPAVKSGRIYGNMGMHQSSLAMAAVVMDTMPETKEWLDFNFQSGAYYYTIPPKVTGGNISALLINDVDRNGYGYESSPQYNTYWINQFRMVADILEGYDLYPAADLYNNPKFRKMFFTMYQLILSKPYSASIGDAGTTGGPVTYGTKEDYIRGFEKYGDPELAQAAYYLNGNKLDGIHGDILTSDPEKVTRDIQQVIQTYGTLEQDSTNLTGYGFAAHRDGESGSAGQPNTQRDIWLYYGINANSHGQRDTLNLGMHAFGLDLAPDLGYPEFADATPNRTEWISNTVSHNTVVVDKSKQNSQTVSIPMHFDSSDMVKLFDVEAPNVYPQTEIYRRTTAMIKVDDKNSYTVDFFRIKGGNEHNFSFHGAEGVTSAEGLNLVTQPTGTYAGPDVEYGIRPDNDSVSGGNYMGAGFHWLKNVERDENPSDKFSVDWNVKDTWNIYGNGAGAPTDIHLRLTMIGNTDDVALADGIPPTNKPGNPESLKYLIARRSGQNLSSLFTSVIEPYNTERYVESISQVSLKADGQVVDTEDAKALKIVLKNGRVDYIIYSLDNTITYSVDDKFQFKGFLGLYSEKDGNPLYAYVNDGESIANAISETKSSLTGTVIDFTRDMSVSNEIKIQIIDTDFEPSDLTGRYIYIQNDGVRNACYQIKGIKSQEGNVVTLDIGDITTIRKLADLYDFSKGYIYDIPAGAPFVIPLSDEVTISLAQMDLSSDKNTLVRNETAGLNMEGKLSNGANADLEESAIEYINSRPDVAAVKNGTITGNNVGSTEIYAKVTLNDVTVQTNVLSIEVETNIETIRSLILEYKKAGNLSGPLVPQLQNSLDQAEHQLKKGAVNQAAKKMEDFIKHLNNQGMQKYISHTEKEKLEVDALSLIDIWLQK